MSFIYFVCLVFYMASNELLTDDINLMFASISCSDSYNYLYDGNNARHVICDPVQQKGHDVGQVYSEIMSKTVCKI